MNQLIDTHYGSVDKGLNEYRIYECTKKKGKVKYIAVVHTSFKEEIRDEKILLEKFPCALPEAWAVDIIKGLDNLLSKLQLMSNADWNYLIFPYVHKEYISKKVQEEIQKLNEIYIKTAF